MSELTLRPAPRAHNLLALCGFLAATYLVAVVSSVFTVTEVTTWYATLAKPAYNPPNQLFGPVWSLLYTLMAVAAWLVWKRPDSRLRTAGLNCFGIQLGLNFLWSFVFFRSHQLGPSVIEIALLWLGILATTLIFFRLSRAAGWLFVPYLAWVSFAAVLNFSIWRSN